MTKRSVRSIFFGACLFAMVTLACSTASFAQIGITVRFGPPPLPVYEQPMLPGDGYLWTPGYWSWDNDYDDYYWVPGTWVQAPEPGLFWTPGYWGWGGNGFLFHEGYWGPRVGYYGGINYGYGYFGEGYQGGRWDNGRFFYNRAVNNVNETIVRNVYVTKVVEVNRNNRVSYNGGEGGITARPRPEDEQAERERHIPPVAAQQQQVRAARGNPHLRASENRGKPPVAATAKPGDFNDHAVAAREAGGAYNPPPNRGGARSNGAPDNRNAGQADRNAEQPNGNSDRNADRPNQPVGRADDNANRSKNIYHPNDLPARQQSSDTAQENKKYQQQVQKMQQKEDQQRQKLQQKQDKDHQKLDQQKADDARKQQVEQRHQQQTEKLQQHEQQQEQKMQSRQPKPAAEPPHEQGRPEGARPNQPAPKDNQPH